jgi:hypothetical protein
MGQASTKRYPLPVELAAVAEAQNALECKFDPHGRACDRCLLFRLWRTFNPNRPFSLRDELWKEALGFQHSEPDSDVRGGGQLAIPQLLYFLDNYPLTAVGIAKRQQEAREKNVAAGYPFATAGVNITRLLANCLGLIDATGQARPLVREQSFWNLLSEEHAISELYCIAFELLDRNFISMDGSYLTFPMVLAETQKELEDHMQSGVADITELRRLALGQDFLALAAPEVAQLQWTCGSCQEMNSVPRTHCFRCMTAVSQRRATSDFLMRSSIASTTVLLTKPQSPKANTRLHDCTIHTRQSQSRDKAEWVVVGDGRNLHGSLNQRKSEAARQAPPARLHNTTVQASLLAHKCRGHINRTDMTAGSLACLSLSMSQMLPQVTAPTANVP